MHVPGSVTYRRRDISVPGQGEVCGDFPPLPLLLQLYHAQNTVGSGRILLQCVYRTKHHLAYQSGMLLGWVAMLCTELSGQWHLCKWHWVTWISAPLNWPLDTAISKMCQRMCCSFYWSCPSGYPRITTTFLHSMVHAVSKFCAQAEEWLYEVSRMRQNQIQPMKLHHFSYITLLKLQHILSDFRKWQLHKWHR